MLKELEKEIEKHSIDDQWTILKKIKARERDKARAKVNRLFERKNPKVEKICQVCGSREKIEFHHIDYSKPYVVNILCKYCHSDFHRGITKIPNAINLEELCVNPVINKKGQKVFYQRQWLKDLWIEKGFETSREIANVCNISSSYIETLARTLIVPSERVAKRIGEVLNFDYNKLLCKQEQKIKEAK